MMIEIYENIAKQALALIAEEWKKQGHNLTGKFVNELTYNISTNSESTKIDLIDGNENAYGVILNKGVPADKIPFSPGSGAKSSKYIAGLTNYAKLRMGASDKDAVSIAFAIAHKHKKEGMPTQASKKYSKTGERTRFVEAVETKITEIIKKEIKWQ